MAYSVLGTYCEYTAVPAAKILKVPDSVGLDVANACMTQGLTAHYLTTDCHAGLIQPGEWCVVAPDCNSGHQLVLVGWSWCP